MSRRSSTTSLSSDESSDADMLDAEQATLLEPNGYGEGTCGYCSAKGERSAARSSKSYGMSSKQMSPRVYQSLIDRGWRRSGTYIYHPDMANTCCPQYTIRLDAARFDAGDDKKLRKVLARWRRWVVDGVRGESAGDEAGGPKKGKGKAKETYDYVRELHAPEAEQAGPIAAHKYTVELHPAQATTERFELYKRYQVAVHGDDGATVTRGGFARFLCDNGLGKQRIPYSDGLPPPPGLPKYYGCFHQLHYVDGTLIAFSVLDILPGCVSSVYFVWDPEYAWASLGKLSAVREAALAKELVAAGMSNMGWLYMGFYIHSCHKMRYKGDYKPSQLLDPGTNVFHPLDKVIPLLEARPTGYTPFERAAGFAKQSKATDSSSAPAASPVTAKRRQGKFRSDFPSPPPPSFADPDSLPRDKIQSILVVLDKNMVLPLGRVPFQSPELGEGLVRELAAAVGMENIAKTGDVRSKTFVCLD